MRMPDHVLGAVLFAAAAAYAAMAINLPGGSPGEYGPELFPLLIAGGVALSSVVLMARRFRSKPVQASEVERPRRNWFNGAVVCGVVVYSIFALPVLGFVLTIGPALIMILGLLGVRLRNAVMIGIAATLAIEFAFRNVLQVPLPSGPGLWGFI
jgi:putative tricarboxylic transport membrane protein